MIRGKRGDTLVNIAFIIGMLLIAVVVTSVLTRFTLFQGKQLEQNALLDFTAQIKNAVERAQSAPNDADFTVQLSYPLHYTLSVDRGTIRIDFPDYNYQAQAISFSAQTFVIGTTVRDSGTLFISKRGTTIMVSNSLRCDLTDQICDPGCILQQVCDPACYQSYLSDVCSPYCVDFDGNGQIDQRDSDGICDPDCYGPDQRGGAYDPDCLRNNDNICDPNTDGKTDAFCDADCLATNGVCDLDCSAYDVDCPHQDNGFCEVERGESCTNEGTDCACDSNTQTCAGICPGITTTDTGCIAIADMRQEGDQCTLSCQCAPGLQCDVKYGTNRCCPAGSYYDGTQCVARDSDNICQVTDTPPESCENSASDCPCTGGDCCPASPNADAQGCVAPTLTEGEACTCSSECSAGLSCAEGACCPAGKEWDAVQNQCVDNKKFRLAVVPVGFSGSNPTFRNYATDFFNYFVVKSPLNLCPDPFAKAELLIVDNECTAANSCFSNLCSASCNQAIINCAKAQYGLDFDKAGGIVNTNSGIGGAAGCAGLSGIGSGAPYLGSRYGGSASIMDPARKGKVNTHETGHDFGLCHNADDRAIRPCNPGESGCSSSGTCYSCQTILCPNYEMPWDPGHIMNYYNIQFFSPSEFDHIKNHPYFNEFLGGCT